MIELDCVFCKINTQYFLNKYIFYCLPRKETAHEATTPIRTAPPPTPAEKRSPTSPHLFLLHCPPLQQGVVRVVATEAVDGGEQAAAVVHGGALPDGRAQLLQQRRLPGQLLPLQAAGARHRGQS